jgi:hypothetical protein
MTRLSLTAISLVFLAAPAFAATAQSPASNQSNQQTTATPASQQTPVMHARQHHWTHMMAQNGDQAQNINANRETRALNVLEAHYGQFSDFRADGNQYSAKVSQNGQPVAVTINPASGQVTRQG